MKSIILSKPSIKQASLKDLKRIIESGWITRGPECDRLEKLISKKLRVKYSMLVNSCTNGIYLSLIALGLKKNDEIIVNPNTFISSINSIYQLGLTPKFCDIDQTSGNLNQNKIISLITNKTKAILINHYLGFPQDLDKVNQICKKKDIKIIEDAAGAFMSRHSKNQFVGSSVNGTVVFSFHANKIISSGEGGLITTNSKIFYERIKLLSYCGVKRNAWNLKSRTRDIDCISPGYKFNFTDIQASLLKNQISNIQKIISIRNKLIKKYDSNLSILFETGKISKINYKKNNNFRSPYTYTIVIKNISKKINRNKLKDHLRKNNINTNIHYKPFFDHSFYKDVYSSKKLFNMKIFYNEVLSLPLHNDLNNRDIIFITRKINDFYNS